MRQRSKSRSRNRSGRIIVPARVHKRTSDTDSYLPHMAAFLTGGTLLLLAHQLMIPMATGVGGNSGAVTVESPTNQHSSSMFMTRINQDGNVQGRDQVNLDHITAPQRASLSDHVHEWMRVPDLQKYASELTVQAKNLVPTAPMRQYIDIVNTFGARVRYRDAYAALVALWGLSVAFFETVVSTAADRDFHLTVVLPSLLAGIFGDFTVAHTLAMAVGTLAYMSPNDFLECIETICTLITVNLTYVLRRSNRRLAPHREPDHVTDVVRHLPDPAPLPKGSPKHRYSLRNRAK